MTADVTNILYTSSSGFHNSSSRFESALESKFPHILVSKESFVVCVDCVRTFVCVPMTCTLCSLVSNARIKRIICAWRMKASFYACMQNPIPTHETFWTDSVIFSVWVNRCVHVCVSARIYCLALAREKWSYSLSLLPTPTFTNTQSHSLSNSCSFLMLCRVALRTLAQNHTYTRTDIHG